MSVLFAEVERTRPDQTVAAPDAVTLEEIVLDAASDDAQKFNEFLNNWLFLNNWCCRNWEQLYYTYSKVLFTRKQMLDMDRLQNKPIVLDNFAI